MNYNKCFFFFFVAIQDERTPLHLACERGYTEIVKMLLADPRGDVNICNKVNKFQYLPALSVMIIDYHCVSFIQSGKTALHEACRYQDSEIVEILLDEPRVDVNASDNVCIKI